MSSPFEKAVSDPLVVVVLGKPVKLLDHDLDQDQDHDLQHQ